MISVVVSIKTLPVMNIREQVLDEVFLRYAVFNSIIWQLWQILQSVLTGVTIMVSLRLPFQCPFYGMSVYSYTDHWIDNTNIL